MLHAVSNLQTYVASRVHAAMLQDAAMHNVSGRCRHPVCKVCKTRGPVYKSLVMTKLQLIQAATVKSINATSVVTSAAPAKSHICVYT